MRVLIAIDGSDGSFEAIQQVAPLLRASRDQLALYCRAPQVHTQIKDAGATARGALAEAIIAKADSHLPTEWQTARQVLLGQDDPRHDIVAAAEKWPADMIAVGARGLGMMKRLLLGSVSRAVVHASTVPVWIARPRAASTPAGHNVLLTSERAAHTRKQAEFLSQLAWPGGTQFTLLSVCTSMVAGHVPDWLQSRAPSPEVAAMIQHWVREHDEEIARHLAELKEAVHDLPEPLRGAQTVVREGDPAGEILDTAAEGKHDLVVVGSKHKRDVASMIFGSTCEAVINHASASVLAVPIAD